MRDDLHNLMQRIQALPDRDLVALLEEERDQYTPEALRIAEDEADTRGGLVRLRQNTAQATVDNTPRKRGAAVKSSIETLFSGLIGRAPSEQYPSLSYVAIAFRLIAFVIAAFALMASGISLYQLVAGGMEPWLVTLGGALRAGVVFLLFYGGSELIHVVLDIEKNTRAGLSEHRERPGLPEESA